MLNEVLSTMILWNIDDPILMLSWHIDHSIVGQGKIIYLKYKLPPKKLPQGKTGLWRRKKKARQRPWSIAIIVTKLIKTLRIIKEAFNATPIIAIEDLTGIAKKRKIDYLAYRQIFNILVNQKKPLTTKEDLLRIFKGRGKTTITQINPRYTSSYCFKCAIQGKSTKVTKHRERLVHCPIHGPMNRDENASGVIMLKGLILTTQTLGRGKPRGTNPGAPPPRGWWLSDEEGEKEHGGNDTAAPSGEPAVYQACGVV